MTTATENPDTALADVGAFYDRRPALAACRGDRVRRLLTEVVGVAIGLAALDGARRLESTVGNTTVLHQPGWSVHFLHSFSLQ